MSERESAVTLPEFSLTSGGGLYRLFQLLRLTNPPMEYLHRRVVAVTLLAWLPLLVISMIAGTAFGGVQVPFFYDISTHVRFLIALPLLLWAEVVVHQVMQPMVSQFLIRRIVPPEAESRFRSLVSSITRWRDSVVAEVLILALTLVIGHFVSGRTALRTSTWYSTFSEAGPSVTGAGSWYVWVSIPVFQFILLRWLFRWSLWVTFLWRVTRLPLTLVPTHPDRAAGLSFLSRAAVAYAPLLTALSAIIGGVLAGKILYEGALLPTFLYDILVTVLLLAVIALGPLCVFIPRLAVARHQGEFEYGTLAMHYVVAFDKKWNPRNHPAEDELLGSADIQSLADLSNSYGIVDGMRMVPFDRNALLMTAACAILPLAPLVLFMIPLDELILKVLGILF